MRPVLFTLPWGTNVNAYGTMILLGTLLAVPLTIWDVTDRGIARGRRLSFLVDLFLVVIIGAFVGGRVVHVLTVPGVYASDPAKLVALDGTGFVFFGSLVAVTGGLAWLARRYDARPTEVWDMGLTWLPLVHAAGRMGCLFAGCCWGGVHTSGGGVRFGPEAIVTLTGGAPIVGRGEGLMTLPLHPTQLYEAIGLLGLVALNAAVRLRVGVETPWRMASRYALGYGCLRAGVEIFRGDLSRGFVLRVSNPSVAGLLSLPPEHPLLLSISQLAAVGMVALGAWGLWRTRARQPTEIVE